ncbi:MAG: hypothetical protein HPY53_05310 [Brevinematales bacterium]|nr:hypothetical protein [Brevinematales bacterium]
MRKIKLISVCFIIAFISSVNGLFGEIVESRYIGGKVVGKGGAISADSMGVSSIFFNPAALSDIKKSLEVWVAYGMPYESVGTLALHEFAFAAGYNLGAVKVAVGFKSTGDFNTLSYNYIYCGGGTSFDLGSSVFKSLAVGLNIKLVDLHAGNVPTYSLFTMNSDALGFSLDVGVQLAMFNKDLVFAINGKNLYSSTLSLIAGGVGDTLKRDLFLGLKYNVTKFLNLTLDYNVLGSDHSVAYLNLFGDSFSFANLYFGIEFDYLENLEIYTGFNEGSLTLGVGLTDSDYFKIDLGLWVVPGLKMYSHIGLSIRPF